MDKVALQNSLANCSLVEHFYFYESVDSTMSQARRLIDGSGNGQCSNTLIVADFQTAGRGRHGRSWAAAKGNSILATHILSLDPANCGRGISDLSRLAAAIPVGLRRGLIPFVADAQIKYPNDIVVRGRKLSGLLLEVYGKNLLIGFGINVLQGLQDLPADARIPATSVFLETGKYCDRAIVLESVLSQIEIVLRADEMDSAVEELNACCETLGQEISVELTSSVFTGIARKIDNAGRLVLETPAGLTALASSEIVRLWPQAPHNHD